MQAPFIEEPMSTYNARRSDRMTSHSLGDFAHSPALYRMKKDTPEPPERNQAFAFGTAAHVGILEGMGKMWESFAVGGPINEKTGKSYGTGTKKFAEWLEASGNDEAISTFEADMIAEMQAAVMAHEKAGPLLEGDTVVEGTLLADICDVPCQSRVDVFNNDTGTIIDLKTCADLDDFERDARKYHYIRQMAFYQMMADANGLEGLSCTLIAVEKKAPYRVGVWLIASRSIETEIENIHSALCNYEYAKSIDQWPTGFEETRILETKKGWA